MASSESVPPDDVNELKVPELKKALGDRGLSTKGLKKELVERYGAFFPPAVSNHPCAVYLFFMQIATGD